jgi:hypothetical protein
MGLRDDVHVRPRDNVGDAATLPATLGCSMRTGIARGTVSSESDDTECGDDAMPANVAGRLRCDKGDDDGETVDDATAPLDDDDDDDAVVDTDTAEMARTRFSYALLRSTTPVGGLHSRRAFTKNS